MHKVSITYLPSPQPSARTHAAGFSLMEVLVAIVIFGIAGLAMTSNAVVGFRFQKSTELGLLAKNLAVSKAEELSGVFLDDLDNSYDLTENNLTVTGHRIPFTRVTDVTIEADGSRTIDVTVSSPSGLLLAPVHITTRLAPWES